ncbi:MAG: TerB family tellurite resistance protein [Pseudomonadota bacterium]
MKNFWNDLAGKLGFEQDNDAEAGEGDASLAAAALLLEMTEADMEVTTAERDAVRRALEKTFGLSAEEIEQTLAHAAGHIDRDVSYYPHVETINAVCDPEAKAQIVEQMWRVAFADGQLDKYEEHYLRRLCQLIHVPHRVFIQARHAVEASLD